MSDIINKGAFYAQLTSDISERLNVSAEEYIQEAMKKYELVVRRRVAESIMATLDNHFDVQMRSDNIVITVKTNHSDKKETIYENNN